MRNVTLILVVLLASRDHSVHAPNMPDTWRGSPPTLTTLAVRVRNMELMTNFYSAAFGATFYPVRTGPITSQFGQVGQLTLKFVPIRDSVDFTDYPIHQPGFRVPDVRGVVALAARYGGRQEGGLEVTDHDLRAAIRDPDGNTIELYGPR